MKKTIRWSAGVVAIAGAAATTLLTAAPASAAPAPAVTAPGVFVCDPGSTQIDVPNPLAAQANQPSLAGSVCTFAGTTAFRYVDTNGGWRVEVKSVFGSKTTNVRFYEPSFNVKPIEVITQGSKVVIKK